MREWSGHVNNNGDIFRFEVLHQAICYSFGKYITPLHLEFSGTADPNTITQMPPEKLGCKLLE